MDYSIISRLALLAYHYGTDGVLAIPKGEGYGKARYWVVFSNVGHGPYVSEYLYL